MPKTRSHSVPLEAVAPRVYLFRGKRIMLAADVATLYGVPTFRLNEAVKRNRDRFPGDFMFRLTAEEAAALRSLLSTPDIGRGGRYTLPLAFTELGVAMVSSVLKSERAVQMNLATCVRCYTRISVFHSIEKQISNAFRTHIQVRYGIDLPVAIEQPRQSDFGEIAVPAAFQLAKQLKQAPKKIAAELVADIGALPGVAAMEVAGNGYINIRLDRARIRAFAVSRRRGTSLRGIGRKDHRRAHQHQSQQSRAHRPPAQRRCWAIRSSACCARAGSAWKCRTTSTTPACRWPTSWSGFQHLEHKTPADVRALLADPAVRFDYFCWDLYARTSAYYKEHPEALEWRSETLHAIEAGAGDVAELAHLVADAIVRAHLATMLRLDVEYDVLPRESEILHLKFWAAAFELLKERKRHLSRDRRQELPAAG